MKNLYLILALISNTAMAESPTAMFSSAENFTNNTNVKWIQVKDVQAACDKQRAKFGAGPFPYSVKACSTWTKTILGNDVCTIITEKNTSMHIIGHELRHCFQGNWKGHDGE